MNTNDKIKEVRRKMEIQALIMSKCYDDVSYRIYQSKYDELVKELIDLEKTEKNENPRTLGQTEHPIQD